MWLQSISQQLGDGRFMQITTGVHYRTGSARLVSGLLIPVITSRCRWGNREDSSMTCLRLNHCQPLDHLVRSVEHVKALQKELSPINSFGESNFPNVLPIL
ncbi:hypothetical protein TNCT_485601 [Trichonephila clavata]|uniref:Uncharacterized protein n=1 Tax=Trichonephila clavata TaxID=2740835 RepID=A0A8X6H7Y4_TRICU|nr:hypothetical protein TNCT_485601 [Trichonephila clavata]